MIHVEGLTVHYGDTPALQDVNLSIAQGECVLITGPSGCGKSTLARALCGFVPQAIPADLGGRVAVGGLDVTHAPLPDVAQRVGMVFQNPSSQLFHLTARDEVAFGPRNLGWPEERVEQSVDWALAATGITDLAARKPSELSGGQKQCLALAAVLVMRPDVLVLDEPTASLDVPGTRRLVQTLRRLVDETNVTLIVIEHRLAEVAQLAQRVIVMDDGRVITDGPRQQILADRKLRDALGLRHPSDAASSPWQALIEPAEQSPNPQRPPSPAPVLEMQGVTAGFKDRTVLEGIDLRIEPGDFVALVGDNGTGKTTLARVAAGLLKPRAGKVLGSNGRRPRPGRDVSLLFQNPVEQLFCNTVGEEVAFGPSNYGRRTDLSPLLRQLDLHALRRRAPLALSMGQQQRTAIAACLALHPTLLILDEPTLGQDWGHLEQLMAYLLEVNASGTAILLVTHDYTLVHHWAQRVILLKQGRIAMDGRLTPRPM